MALSQNPSRVPMISLDEPITGGVVATNFRFAGSSVYSRNFDVMIAGVPAGAHATAEQSPIELLTASVHSLRDAIEDLKGEIASLKEHLEVVIAFAAPHPRKIPDDDARQEIKDYFESLHGEVIFPSEIAENLNLNYDQVVRLVQDLVGNGEIAAT